MTRRWLSRTLAALAAAACLLGCRGAPDGNHADKRAEPEHAELDRMHGACVSAMIASACRVMVGSAPTDAAPTVLIAGVGRIDAQAYRALRESGDAMCGVARDACRLEWDGASCRSARALWSAPPMQTVATR